MKAKTIKKTIDEKVSDWLGSLPLELSEKISKKVVVTGGAIASMFLKEPVNDYDMYFKDIKTAILVSQHYCSKWIQDNEEGKRSDKVHSKLEPNLRLTFVEGSYNTYRDYFCKDTTVANDKLETLVVHPQDPAIESFLQARTDWEKCIRVEIFIKSAGFVGQNPDEEYDYFETRESGEAGDYIDNSLINTDVVASDNKNKYETVFMSSNAITLTDKVQLVIRFYGEPDQIHDTYDFIHATNYWTKETGLVTNTKALEALLAKELIYSGSKYPLASIFRTRKFIKREWSCHVGNFIKMALQLNEMDLNDPVVLEEQLTGVDAAYMYEIIRAVKDKQKKDPNFEFNSAYVCELVDRMMGLSGMNQEDDLVV